MTRKHLTALFAAVTFAALAGCSSPTVMTLNDGTELQTTDQPKYDEDSGFYEFEQLDGKPVRINKDDVHTIKKM